MSNFFRKLRKILGQRESEIAPLVSPPVVSARGIECIKHFESCLEKLPNGMIGAYPDPAHGWKVPTIGWGTIAYEDGRPVRKGDMIPPKRADALLAWEVAEKAEAVRRLVKVPVNADQFAALVSFAYNVGVGNLESSTLLKWLNAGSYNNAADQFLKWTRAGGKVLPGLVRRRKSERNLFLGKEDFIER
jgi:lysozyme